jgi:hypothetical protein
LLERSRRYGDPPDHPFPSVHKRRRWHFASGDAGLLLVSTDKMSILAFHCIEAAPSAVIVPDRCGAARRDRSPI